MAAYDPPLNDLALYCDTMFPEQTENGDFVKLTGNQTISGIKTFLEPPICGITASTATQLVNKSYVDNSIASIPVGYTPVLLSNVLISSGATGTTNAGINILALPYTSRQQEIIPPLNCVVVNQNTGTASVRMDESGYYKCEMNCVFSSNIGVTSSQGVGLSICSGNSYIPYGGTGTLPNGLFAVKQGIIPYNNYELEQTISCIIRVIAGDTVSFYLNPNTLPIVGATAIGSGIGTSYNVFRIA